MFIPIRQRTFVVHSRSRFSFIIERHYNIIDMYKNLTKNLQENIKKMHTVRKSLVCIQLYRT